MTKYGGYEKARHKHGKRWSVEKYISCLFGGTREVCTIKDGIIVAFNELHQSGHGLPHVLYIFLELLQELQAGAPLTLPLTYLKLGGCFVEHGDGFVSS